jgi:FkbM family methyltransferase
MSNSTSITLIDGVQIVVPDSLDLITPYVLTEQLDWFEDEIEFLRRLLRPGQKVIDIGANYGVYTLTMAQAVGQTGCVWAFEPASNTAKMLADGIAANGFSQVILEQCALSSASGTARLFLNEHSELNSLAPGGPITSASEAVSVVTLDDCMKIQDWQDIDFVKVDAEGEESKILNGGKRFFKELSPLVQYEIKAGTDSNLHLADEFAELGYHSYRLIPGLDLLIPFDADSTPDGYLLNLFCCKHDRMERLAAQGSLLDPEILSRTTGTDRFNNILELVDSDGPYDWRKSLVHCPYGRELAPLWELTMTIDQSTGVGKGLAFYAISRDSSLSACERFTALEASFSIFKPLCERQPSYLRLASLARVARDYGARSIAVEALIKLLDAITQFNTLDMSEPFLSPTERFDSIPPGEAIGNWALAAILEGLEQLASFSSFYTGESARQRLEAIHSLGFGSKEMERRLSLVQKRFGLRSTSPKGSSGAGEQGAINFKEQSRPF